MDEFDEIDRRAPARAEWSELGNDPLNLIVKSTEFYDEWKENWIF